MKNMMNWLTQEESGQGMIEYALLLGIIAIGAVAAITLIGGHVKSKFELIETKLRPTTT